MTVLESIFSILLLGFLVGQIALRLRLPALLGMIVVGILLRQAIAPEVLAASSLFRTVAVMVILMKAGLGLDRDKLLQQGSVALRLGILPALIEAIAIMVASVYILRFDVPSGLLLGCIIGAESPAVIVPAMLKLKSLGWGVQKGIPDAILVGTALSDVLLLLLFGLLVSFLGQGVPLNLPLLVGQSLLQIVLGIGMGWMLTLGLRSLLSHQNWTEHRIQDTLVAASVMLITVVTSVKLPIFSGYLAVMATGFFLIELDAPLARRLRTGFDGLWLVAQIFLFVLLGAEIDWQVLGSNLGTGLVILAIGTLVGRSVGWYFSTLGSNWTWREKLFLLPANSAKATVQAAIGSMPLSLGLSGGAEMLAIAVLAIVITAPLGAWAIPTFAPKLLQKDNVDPTKVSITQNMVILTAIDTSFMAHQVLQKTAEIARRSEAEVVVLHVLQGEDLQTINRLQGLAKIYLTDVRHQFMTASGGVASEIVRIAQELKASEIIMGKRGDQPQVMVGSVSQAVLASSSIPVMVLENQG